MCRPFTVIFQEDHMKTKLIAAALVAGLSSPAAAATLDFTSTAIGTGNTTGTVFGDNGYKITGSGQLTDATHGNKVDCPATLACAGDGRYDVGFGVLGTNGNEVDGIDNDGVSIGEYVQVKFDRFVKLLGFTGMLTYDDSDSSGTETVVLEVSNNGGTTFFASFIAAALKNDNGNSFDTVGLASLTGLSIEVNAVRFRAGGVSPFDDGNSNITAAALELAPVPVPAALPLLLAGLGALGLASRRRRARMA
jgi:hypothetical protein